ncbi:MAG: DUF3576 domain-containing protein [Pikeienuella sp.]
MTLFSAFVRGLAVAAMTGLAACSGNYAQDPDFQTPTPKVGQGSEDPFAQPGLFDADGLTLTRALDGSLFSGQEEELTGGRLPVNRYIWQGALETLDFLPLDDADPFTGIIATEWARTPESPEQRFKVTAYIQSYELEASSLRVAVFREDQNVEGVWIPTPVSAETVRRLEDAILTRARQIRIAELEQDQAG